MKFSDIEDRENGKKIAYSWFNGLRDAGLRIESIFTTGFGAGASSAETTFPIANNQTGASITGLVASSLYRVTRIRYWVRRVATDTVLEAGELIVIFDGTNFYLGRTNIETPTTAGMSFDVNITTGQIKYDSSNMAGSYDAAASKIGFIYTTQGTI